MLIANFGNTSFHFFSESPCRFVVGPGCDSVPRPRVGVPASAERAAAGERAQPVDVVQHAAQEQGHAHPHRRRPRPATVRQRRRPDHAAKVCDFKTVRESLVRNVCGGEFQTVGPVRAPGL